MAYTVTLVPAAVKDLEDARAQQNYLAIVNALFDLASDRRPDGVKKLKGQKDMYRVRVGNYRIVYQVDDDDRTIYILGVDDRKDAYG